MSNAIIRHVKPLSLSLQPSYMCSYCTYNEMMFLELEKEEGGRNRWREEKKGRKWWRTHTMGFST